MRFKIIHSAAALALAVSAANGDSMCVVKHENSGMLFETPCDNLPLHPRNGGGLSGKAMEEPHFVYGTSTVMVTATITAESLALTDEEGFSTLSVAYTTTSAADVTATLPVVLLTTARSTRTRDDGSKETLFAVQPAEQTTSVGKNLNLLYDCNLAPNDFIICPFKGRNPPPEMFPAPTAAVLNVQRDAPSSPEAISAASVLASMVAATNLWPTGVHPFVAPTPTFPPTSDCVDSLAEEFAMTVHYTAPPPPGFLKNKKPISNLGINLVNGTLIDTLHRLGSIVANRQLQFDAFGQAGSIYTAGFQACGPSDKRLLALGGSTVWWGCVSGTFMNLYDQNIAPQCVKLQLSLLNNLEPGGDLNAAAESVSISTTLSHDDVNPTTVEKRATFTSPSNTWLHTMLLGSTPVPVSAPYPVFTTDGVVWSATKTKLHGTHATYVGAAIATAHAKRNDLNDGVANDVPTFFRDISTVVTVNFAAETIKSAAATGEDDKMETITAQPSTITQIIPAGQTTSIGDAKEKRDESAVTSGNATTTASFVFNPITTFLITEPATSSVSQAVTTLILTQTSTITVKSANIASSSITSTAEPASEILSTVTEVLNGTATTTHSNEATQFVTVSQTTTSSETTPFVTAEATTTSPLSNSTTQVVILSTVTDSQGVFNGTIPSSYIPLNISTFIATGLTLTHAPTSLLSTSTSFVPSTTTDAVLSGSIGTGEPAASTTVAISGAEGKPKYATPGYVPICTAMFVGLTVAFFAERYLGRLHF